MSNPTLNENTFNNAETVYVSGSEVMTLNGTITKAFLLTLLTIAAGAFSWHSFNIGNMPMVSLMMMAGGIIGFILALVICFKQKTAPMLAPVYAVCEGLLLGGISAMYNAEFYGIIIPAVLGTFATLFSMLALYVSRIIKVTEKLRAIIIGGTFAIAISYLIIFLLSLFHVNIPMSNNVAIILNIIIIFFAAFNFLLDFDVIERGVNSYMPKYFEWYCSFGLLVTIVWLYMEILKLLARLRSSRN